MTTYFLSILLIQVSHGIKLPIDCATVGCAFPVCGPNEQIFIPPNQCCPTCKSKLDCKAVLCPLRKCLPGQVLFTPQGKCCPICASEGDDCGIPGKNCPALKGPSFLCPDDKTCFGVCGICTFEKNQQTDILECAAIIPKERVCPDTIDCKAVRCALPNCGAGEIEYVPEGECCSQCKPADKECPVNQCMDATSHCVYGSDFNCKVAPCMLDNGGCKHGQMCTNNYCNGCNAVCSRCPKNTHCMDGLNNCVAGRIINCFIDPCMINNGGCGENYECKSNYCNGCNAICVPKCNDLQCRNGNGLCQTKTCMLDPCNDMYNPCPGQLCNANTCSSPVCKAQCGRCPSEGHCVNAANRCVAGSIYKCYVNPCHFDNGGCGDKKCIDNYCNGCNAVCV